MTGWLAGVTEMLVVAGAATSLVVAVSRILSPFDRVASAVL